MKLDDEIWKPVLGFDGLYEVSNLGNVKSLNYRRKGKPKILKLTKMGTGYLCVKIKGKLMLVHQLVAKSFLDNPNNYPQVDHINTIRTDNNVNNLRWVNQSMNNLNPITNERFKHAQKEFHIVQLTLSGYIINEWNSISEASRVTSVNKSNIQKACNNGFYSISRNKWVNVTQAGGYKWRYKDES